MKFISGARTAIGALALASALVAPAAKAAVGDIYASPLFQGINFIFTQTDADTLKFEIKGTPNGDWSTANYLGAFDLKDLGLNFNTVTGTANGPGATNLAGLNTQLSASSVDCLAAGSPPGSICFDISPDKAITPLPMDFIYTIDFSAPLNIASTGIHLQIAFTQTIGGAKVGSLYSKDIAKSGCVDCGGGGGNSVPEPGTLALFGLSLGLAGYISSRRRKA